MVNTFMALCAKSNEVVLIVLSRVTAKLFVVNFKICHRSAGLTSPAVAL